MNLVVKQEEVRIIMSGHKNGFELSFEFVKVNNMPIEAVYFSGFKGDSTISGNYHSVGNQLNVSAGGHDEGLSDILDDIVFQCRQLCDESNTTVID